MSSLENLLRQLREVLAASEQQSGLESWSDQDLKRAMDLYHKSLYSDEALTTEEQQELEAFNERIPPPPPEIACLSPDELDRQAKGLLEECRPGGQWVDRRPVSG